jgi:predicted DNA-binding transcriptional regulator AlpA
MKLHLRSIDQAPASLPIWQAILEDLAHPPVHRISKVLGVSQRTVYRWNAAGQAPKVAQLALFWLTRWGQSAVHAQASNDCVLAVQVARSMSERVQQLTADLERLKAITASGGRHD